MRHLIALLLLVFSLSPAYSLASEAGIIVNGKALSAQDIQQYEITVPAGRYWYDPVSGLWGQEGGPGLGQIAAGLPLGGQLKADASGSGSGVFINGREIHGLEVMVLMEYFGEPIPVGRYWLGADGTGGVEGQAASFTLNPQQESGGTGKVFEDEVADFCIRNGGCPF